MTTSDPKVPTGPGWWWLCVGRFPQPVRVEDSSDGLCFTVTGNGWVPVTYYSNPGEWGGPVPSPSDHAALLAERDALRAEVAMLRAAVTPPSPRPFWPNPYMETIVKSTCLHRNCPTCHGTGRRADGLGPCVHSMSCPCPSCTPR